MKQIAAETEFTMVLALLSTCRMAEAPPDGRESIIEVAVWANERSEGENMGFNMNGTYSLNDIEIPHQRSQSSSPRGSGCPRCGDALHRDVSMHGGLFICTSCGWTESLSEKRRDEKVEKQTVGGLIIGVALLTALTLHTFVWGSNALTIPFYKLGQLTGTLSVEGYDRLADICMDVRKYACARQAYVDSYRQTQAPDSLTKLARLQVRMQENPAAMVTLTTYFRAGGTDGEAAILLGQLLEQSGQDSEALRMYEKSIELRPDQLPVSATGAIVRILMRQGRYEEAHSRLLSFHASAGNAKGYLNTELYQVEQAIQLYRKTTPAQSGGKAGIRKS